MPDDRVEILIRARDEATAVLNNAIRSVVKLNSETARTGALAKTNFRDMTNALSLISPQAGQVAARVAGVGDAVGSLAPGLGAAGVAAGGLAAGLGLVAAAGLVAAHSFSDQIEQLGNLAAATGSTLQDLQVLQETFKRAGLGAESADRALGFLNRQIAESNPLLAKLGITARDPVQALLQLAQAFEGSTDSAAKTRIAFSLLGRGSLDILKIIDQLRESFPGLRTEMAATGQLFSKDMVDAGKKFDDEWDRFTGRFEGFMHRMGAAAAEAANAIIDAFKNKSPDDAVAQHIKDMEKNIGVLGARIREERENLGKGVADPAGLDELFFGKEGLRSEGLQRIAKLQAEMEKLTRYVKIAKGEIKEFGEDNLPEFGDAATTAASKVTEVAASLDHVAKKALTADEKMKAFANDIGALVRAADEVGPMPDILPRGFLSDEAIKKQEAAFKRLANLQLKPIDVPAVRLFSDTSKLGETKQQWLDTFDEIVSAAGIFDSAMSVGFFGISDAFATVVESVVGGANIMKLRFLDVMRSMVSAAIRELARLAAVKLLRLVLSLVGPVGAAAGAVIDSPIGLGAGESLASIAPAPSQAPEAGTRNVNVNVAVSAIDVKGVSDFFNSPMGAGRLASLAQESARPA